jgi:hypothetical protein
VACRRIDHRLRVVGASTTVFAGGWRIDHRLRIDVDDRLRIDVDGGRSTPVYPATVRRNERRG